MTLDKTWFLLNGFYLDRPESRFPDLEEIKRTWNDHAAEIMAEWKRQNNRFRRPWVWWCFEASIPVQLDSKGEGMSLWAEVERRGGQEACLGNRAGEWEHGK